MPKTTAPAVKYKKRSYWTKEQLRSALDSIPCKSLLHLMIHMSFMCALRTDETVGMGVPYTDLEKKTLFVRQILTRVSHEALERTPKDEIVLIFPNQIRNAKSVLILKDPKTDESQRTLYLNDYLVEEIRQRLTQIQIDKNRYGDEYRDYDLLFCRRNDDPIEPRRAEQMFKNWQAEAGIEESIDLQSIRKSSSMYKLRVSGFNYQEIQGETGYTTPTVLMEHYNDVMASERQALSQKVQTDFWDEDKLAKNALGADSAELLKQVLRNPLYADQLAKSLKNMPLDSQMFLLDGFVRQEIKPKKLCKEE